MFQPVKFNTREYVDGGLVSPVPVKTARDMGADVIVAVNISDRPKLSRLKDTIDVMMQTFTIMGGIITEKELAFADVVVEPDISALNSANFESRNQGSPRAARIPHSPRVPRVLISICFTKQKATARVAFCLVVG